MHDRELYMVDPLNKFMGLIAREGFREIRRHAFADILRLTHVKKLVLFVKVFINTRLSRQAGCYAAEYRTRHGILAYWKTYSIPHIYFTVLFASLPLWPVIVITCKLFPAVQTILVLTVESLRCSSFST